MVPGWVLSIVEAPPGAAEGPADITVARGAANILLPGGIRYVPRIYPDIRLEGLVPDHGNIIVRGVDGSVDMGPALADLDGDGLADVIASATHDAFIVLHGSTALPGEIVLGDPPSPAPFSRIETGGRYGVIASAIGDVNGDGTADLAVRTSTGIHILLGGERLPPETSLEDLAGRGRATAILHASPGGGVDMSMAGGADIDGDGLGDVAVGWADRIGSSSRVYLLAGRRDWPRELFLEDAATVVNSTPKAAFGEGLALLPDITGDGRDEVLVGAQGPFWKDDGHAYLLAFDAIQPGRELLLEEVIADGGIRFDSRQPKDSLGHRACAPGDGDGDGIADFALSAMAGGPEFHGETYVVFGASLGALPPGEPFSMRNLAGRGTRITGEWRYDYAMEIAPAGDFNGDGRGDLLIVANATDLGYGKAYVVFGGAPRDVSLEHLGGDGVRIVGLDRYSLGHFPAGGGDVNGDGLDDVVLASQPQGQAQGDSFLYVLFGQAERPAFIRGDSNGDRKVQISDAVHALGYLFLGTEDPSCLDAADGNDDGRIDIADAVYVLAHLFLGGLAPPAPFPDAGADPTLDGLDCGEGP